LTVTDEDRKNFLEFGLDEEKVIKVGDTRYDRVFQKSLVAKDKKLFKEGFFSGKKVFVMGSSWDSDEEVLLPSVIKLMKHHPEVVLIIAPHEPTIQHLEKLEEQFSQKITTIRFSSKNAYANERVIIIDSIGILLSLYYYADFVFVGGGFKQNVHNVLEPAVYGLPVLFGPKIQNSQEALSLIEEGSATIIYNKKDAYRVIKKLITDDKHRKKLGNISAEFVRNNIGATGKILEEINKFVVNR
jgi:3-deoxy-D-manno-octulosonic-acid transferase